MSGVFWVGALYYATPALSVTELQVVELARQTGCSIGRGTQYRAMSGIQVWHSVEAQTASLWKHKRPHVCLAPCGSTNRLMLVWHSVEAQTASRLSGTVSKHKRLHACLAQCGSTNGLTFVWHSVEAQMLTPTPSASACPRATWWNFTA